MQRGGYVQEALSFAYKLLRNNFSNPAAHKAYLGTLSPLAPSKPNIPAPESVSPGTAVRFEEDGSQQEQWVIIEDEFDPDRKLHEVAPSEALARELNGKRVGDRFVVGQNRHASVKAILNKYVYRYQECLSSWELNFPEVPLVQMIRVVKPGGEPGSEEFDLTAVFKQLDRLEERSKVIEEVYTAQPVPLHVFGDAFGKDSFRAIYYLAEKPRLHVNCCVGSAEEWATALESYRNAGEVVLDLTGIATLSLLKSEDLLSGWTAPPVVSQGTMMVLEDMLREDGGDDSERRFLGKIDGRYTLVKTLAEDRRGAKERLSQLIKTVKSSCRILPCQSLANVSPEVRKLLTEAFGQYGAESIALASAPGRVLWTDDRLLGGTARTELGVRSAWTQVVLEARVGAGLHSPDFYFESSAKLLGWGYFFTRVSLPTLTRAGALADWNPEHWPLEQALDSFALDSVELLDLVKLAAGLIPSVCREVSLPERRQAIIVRILERLASRRQGSAGVRVLQLVLPTTFGLNMIGAREALQIIRAWLTSRQHDSEGPPIVGG